MGKETSFKEQAENGDMIIIMHPTTLGYETRSIKAVLSNVSILLDEPFSTDLISYQSYQFIRNPHARAERKKETMNADKAAKKLKTKDSKTLTYRVKKPGAYGVYETVTQSQGVG